MKLLQHFLGKEPIVYVTTDMEIDTSGFEEVHKQKFGKDAMLVIVGQGHSIERVK